MVKFPWEAHESFAQRLLQDFILWYWRGSHEEGVTPVRIQSLAPAATTRLIAIKRKEPEARAS